MAARKRDPRTFRPFVKLADDGSIAAVVHVADGAPMPADGAGSIFVDVSTIGTEHVSGGRTIRGGNVDLVKDVGVKAAIATAIAEDKAKKTPIVTPPPKDDGPPINTTRGIGGVIDLG